MGLKNNLISVWDLDGDANDSHGSNDATAGPGLTYTTGKVGQCGVFTKDTDETLTTGYTAPAATHFSVSFWVKYNDSSNLKIYDTDDSDNYLSIWCFSDEIRASAHDNTDHLFVNGGDIADDAWHHVVVVYDNTEVELRIYVDNSLIASDDTAVSGLSINGGAVYLGSDGGTGNPFEGNLDQIAIWDKIIDTDDISELYNSGSGLAYSSWSYTEVPEEYIDDEFSLTEGADHNHRNVGEGLGLSESVSALTYTQGISEGIGLSEDITALTYSQGISEGLGLNDLEIGGRGYTTGIEESLVMSDTQDGENFTAWYDNNHSRIEYYYTIGLTTRTQRWQISQVIPAKSFQARRRSGYPSYLSVVVPYSVENLNYITAHNGGDLVVLMEARVNGVVHWSEEISRVAIEGYSISEGGTNSSITITGHYTYQYARGYTTLYTTLKNVMTRTLQQNGFLRFRCAVPDFYLYPGMRAYYDGSYFYVESISYVVNSRTSYMDVTEGSYIVYRDGGGL